ncbi:MAG: GNAT family N-acetyltransferase [Oscillospiraceae bacterium]|nr:GNAT family N-acetyltransferase [Oscillospiraceae bacterium]
MEIVPYSNEKQQVVNLLVELQEYLVSVDEESVQTIDNEYGEKYFIYLQELIKKHDGIILLAVSGSEVDGFIAGYIEPKDEEDVITNRCPRRGIISDLAVTAPRRGSEIGKDLMSAIERYFSEMNCEFVAVDLFAPNDTARKFYDSLGYTPRNIELYKRLKR